MEAFKGLQYTVQAFAYAQARASVPLRMIFVGDGTRKQELESYVNKMGVSGVSFVGRIKYSEVLHHYQKGDIFLHMPIYLPYQATDFTCYHTETMGRSILEASCAGLPVVAAGVGGVPEIVQDGKSGYLVNEKDYEAAGEKLLLLQDPDLRNQLGSYGRSLGENEYSWKIVFQKYHRLFQSLNG